MADIVVGGELLPLLFVPKKKRREAKGEQKYEKERRGSCFAAEADWVGGIGAEWGEEGKSMV
jgi:hypothetical protein